MSITTMEAPVGMLYRKDRVIPTKNPKRESIDAKIMVPKKFLHTRIAVIEGNTIRLEIKRVPIILMPSTMVMEVSKAKTML